MTGKYNPGRWVWKIRDKGIERQSLVTGRPIRPRADGRREIQEYLLDDKLFDGFDKRLGVLREVKDNYDFAFAPDKMRSWRNGQRIFEAWAKNQQNIAMDALDIAKRHGFSYEYVVDPRHLEDWKRVLAPAMERGLIVKGW